MKSYTASDNAGNLHKRLLFAVGGRRPMIAPWVEEAEIRQSGSTLLLTFSQQCLAWDCLQNPTNRKFLEEIGTELFGTTKVVFLIRL